jgi:phosphoribosylanthranilate isomerase
MIFSMECCFENQDLRPDPREDVDAAVAAGADAIGFVFYPPSPRYVTPQRAAELAKRIPPFVDVVGLFVNECRRLCTRLREPCRSMSCSFMATRMRLIAASFQGLSAGGAGEAGARSGRIRPLVSRCPGLLLDAFVEGYGGGGHVFDWTLIPPDLPGFWCSPAG